jgi:hypothetical protein
MFVPKGFVNQGQIDAGVQRAMQALRPEVVRIRYSLRDDWTGEASVFFRVVLSDEASREAQLREVTQRVERTILDEVQPQELGLQWYFNFRSLSEQEELQEPAWA